MYATESGTGKFDGISIEACAPYGTYDVEYVIFDESETSTVSGALGVNVFRGFCEVRILREMEPISCAIGDMVEGRGVVYHFFLSVWGITRNTHVSQHTR